MIRPDNSGYHKHGENQLPKKSFPLKIVVSQHKSPTSFRGGCQKIKPTKKQPIFGNPAIITFALNHATVLDPWLCVSSFRWICYFRYVVMF
jgi:hypothetical protein